MKKIILGCLFGMGLLVSCSNDDSKGSAPGSGALVKQIVASSDNNFNSDYLMAYDDAGRNAKWSYSPLQVYREEAEPTYPNGEPVYSYTANLDAQGRIAEAFTKNNGYSYARYYTYDAQGHVIKEEISQQHLNSSGTPTTNMQPMGTFELEWENDNLVAIIYQSEGSDHYAKTAFSDFTDAYKNTLKPKNFGFDFFGPHGYPSADLHGGGNGGFYYDETYAGKQMPQTSVYRYYFTATDEPYNNAVYTYEYTYKKDNKGRLVEVYKNGTDHVYWRKVRYSYE